MRSSKQSAFVLRHREPGGFIDISPRIDPRSGKPGVPFPHTRTLEGCQQRVCAEVLIVVARSGTPAGVLDFHRFLSRGVAAALAQPRANRFQASGLSLGPNFPATRAVICAKDDAPLQPQSSITEISRANQRCTIETTRWKISQQASPMISRRGDRQH